MRVIIVLIDKMSDEVSSIINSLSEDFPQMLSGFRGDELKILEQRDLIRIYANCGKVFVRISNSEIINLKKVSGFDLSITGTICVKMSDGTVTYVSRRYIGKIKQILGI